MASLTAAPRQSKRAVRAVLRCSKGGADETTAFARHTHRARGYDFGGSPNTITIGIAAPLRVYLWTVLWPERFRLLSPHFHTARHVRRLNTLASRLELNPWSVSMDIHCTASSRNITVLTSTSRLASVPL